MSMFWKVKPVPKEDEANMRAELVTVSELTHIFGHAPKPQPRPKPQQPLARAAPCLRSRVRRMPAGPPTTR